MNLRTEKTTFDQLLKRLEQLPSCRLVFKAGILGEFCITFSRTHNCLIMFHPQFQGKRLLSKLLPWSDFLRLAVKRLISPPSSWRLLMA